MFKREVIYGCEAGGDKDSPYLIRYTLLRTPWFQLCIHKFLKSDLADLHDHPWNFWTLILWRGYNDVTFEKPENHVEVKRRMRFGSFARRYSTHLHRVELIDEKPAISLVCMFKYHRHWGFVEKIKERFQWTHWQTYIEKKGC